MFVVYKLTRSDNKLYIGITTKARITKRMNEHRYSKKFRSHTFTKEILEEGILEYEDVLKREKYYVQLYDTWKNGLNGTPTGHGGYKSHLWTTLGYKHTDATKLKMSKIHKGKIPWNKGKTGYLSKEVLEKWSRERKGVQVNTKLTLEQVKEIRERFDKFEFTPIIGKNGRLLLKEQQFSKVVHKEYNMTVAGIRAIVTRKTWNV